MSNSLEQYINENKHDAVVWKAKVLLEAAQEDIHRLAQNFEAVVAMLALIPEGMLLDNYIKIIAKQWDSKPDTIAKAVKKVADHAKRKEEAQEVDEGKKALPSWINKENYYTYGFDQLFEHKVKENVGIWFAQGNNEAKQLTNFTIKPLIHIYSQDDTNRRLTEVNNGWKKSVIELPNKAWVSSDMFESTMLDEGSFMTYDGFAKSHLNRLKRVLIPQYGRGYELGKLGWQKEGFFAYSNLILYNGEAVAFDEYGIAEIKGIKYLSMGTSSALADLRDENNDYKNDKYLTYVEANLSFTDWAKYMMDAYKEKGMMAVGVAALAAYKDIVFKRNNNCPLPYFHGPASSGKTKYAESIANIFTHDMPALNLNQTTIFAFWDYLERFKNVPQICNEFDEKAISDEIFRAFKGAYDGEGRKKGTGKKGQSKTQDINALPIMLGQFLTTGDDGSVLQRSLPLKFTVDANRTTFQIQRFRELKELEKKGVTSVSGHLFRIRDHIASGFVKRYYECYEEMKNALAADGHTVNERILENYVNLYSITSILSDKIELPFELSAFFKFCKDQIKTLTSTIKESNALAGFWNAVEAMVDQEHIEQGYHYKIETKSEVVLAATERNKTHKKVFPEAKKLLFLRLGTIHSLYQKALRSATGKSGLELENIKTYMAEHEAFIGSNPSSSFKNEGGKTTITSSYVFDYDLLGVNIERTKEVDDDRREETLEAVVHNDAVIKDSFGALVVSFTLVQDKSYHQEGMFVENIVYTNCTSREIEFAKRLKKGAKITASGLLEEKVIGDNLRRKLEVKSIKIHNGEVGEPQEMSF